MYMLALCADSTCIYPRTAGNPWSQSLHAMATLNCKFIAALSSFHFLSNPRLQVIYIYAMATLKLPIFCCSTLVTFATTLQILDHFHNSLIWMILNRLNGLCVASKPSHDGNIVWYKIEAIQSLEVSKQHLLFFWKLLMATQQAQCAIDANGKLKDASKIDFYYSETDDTPLPPKDALHDHADAGNSTGRFNLWIWYQ